jgi:hypothetical protein
LSGGPLPATRYVALSFPASAGGGLLLLGFVLLLTPTGKLPSPGWRWWARAMVAVPLGLVVLVTLAPGPVDPSVQVVGGPFEFHGLGGALLVVNQLALAFTTLAVVVCAGSLVVRYRLYDLDRIISRTVAYGLLTLLLGGGYAAVVLGLGQLLGRHSSLVVAGATLAVAGLFQPARRRIQQAVDRRFNRRRHAPPRRSRRSATGCAIRWTWTHSQRSCWRWSRRRCSRTRRRCGYDRKHPRLQLVGPDWEDMPRGGSRTLDLPITSRMLGVDLDGSRRI